LGLESISYLVHDCNCSVDVHIRTVMQNLTYCTLSYIAPIWLVGGLLSRPGRPGPDQGGVGWGQIRPLRDTPPKQGGGVQILVALLQGVWGGARSAPSGTRLLDSGVGLDTCGSPAGGVGRGEVVEGSTWVKVSCCTWVEVKWWQAVPG
jgi:hypothetical protein